MLDRLRLGCRQWTSIPAGIPAILVVVLAVVISCTSTDTGTAPTASTPTLTPSRPPAVGLGSGPEYYGPSSLEERIAWADVIARVRLRSVSSAAEQLAGQTGYFGALEHRFEVLEYLRGNGGSELVAVVFAPGTGYSTGTGARTRGDALQGRRDTQWDDREAVVFLKDAHPGLPSSQQTDRYWFGTVSYSGEDYYTIASRSEKRWLPAASAGGASGSSGAGTQRFLLDAPTSTGASGQSGAAATITLAEMKTKIAEIEQKVTAGGGSEAYRDCLYYKYEWEREVGYMKEFFKETFGGHDYFYLRHDHAIDAGLPAGTRAFTDPYGGSGETAPADAGEFRLMGRDSKRFAVRWPGVADTVRPLPAGEYKFYYSYRPKKYLICDAHPEEEMKRREVFVTVTAPSGTAHEAFFDPVAIGAGFGADGTNGALTPTAFTVGGASTSLSSLTWQGGSVVLTLAPYAALTGQTLDVLAVDGALTLSLAASAATVDATAGTLTWSVASQPWKAGDLLMLRLRSGAASPTATP